MTLCFQHKPAVSHQSPQCLLFCLVRARPGRCIVNINLFRKPWSECFKAVAKTCLDADSIAWLEPFLAVNTNHFDVNSLRLMATFSSNTLKSGIELDRCKESRTSIAAAKCCRIKCSHPDPACERVSPLLHVVHSSPTPTCAALIVLLLLFCPVMAMTNV